MNVSRIGLGILIGAVFGGICFWVTSNTFYSIITLIVVASAIIYFDPKTRYGRWAQSLQWATFGYNFFTFTGLLKSENLILFFESGEQTLMNVVAGVIIIVLYVLDYLNRKKDGENGSNWTFSFGNNSNFNIGLFNQQDNSVTDQRTQINTNEFSYYGTEKELLIKINGEEVYTNDFKFIRELTEKRRRLELLANTDQENNYSSEITELQEEINNKTDYLKKHLEEIKKYSTEEIRNIKLSEARKWAMEVNRKAKHAMIDIDIAMGEHDFLSKLGIAPEYIDQITYDIEEGHVSNDGLVYYYLCRFSEDSPERIIKNINGIEKDTVGYYVRVEPWELETEEPEQYDEPEE